jgi:hypothetical protein
VASSWRVIGDLAPASCGRVDASDKSERGARSG